MMTPHMLPAVAWQLPRLHSLVVDHPPCWRGLPLALSLDHLVELDLQVPTHLRYQLCSCTDVMTCWTSTGPLSLPSLEDLVTVLKHSPWNSARRKLKV